MEGGGVADDLPRPKQSSDLTPVAEMCTSSAVSDAQRDVISSALAQIESEEAAIIPLAIESGSRAWGFHSPDSDYDVRFVYVRPVDWHLSIQAGSDVIERPIDTELDLSGWDLRKALGLILKSNAVILEWLQSPIRYRDDTALRTDLLEFCGHALRPKPLAWHYLRLGSRQRDGLRTPDGKIKLKRYFYTLRPALALRWLRRHPGEQMVPMHMEALVAQTDLPVAVTQWIDELIAVKRSTGEMGSADATHAETDALIDLEFSKAETFIAGLTTTPTPSLLAEADALHTKWVHRVTEQMT